MGTFLKNRPLEITITAADIRELGREKADMLTDAKACATDVMVPEIICHFGNGDTFEQMPEGEKLFTVKVFLVEHEDY